MDIKEEAKRLKREYHREYMRKWRKKNPDKVKKYNKRYWIKKAKEEKQA